MSYVAQHSFSNEHNILDNWMPKQLSQLKLIGCNQVYTVRLKLEASNTFL